MTETEIISSLSIISKDGISTSLPYLKAVFALGTFDGVHIAHRALIESAKKLKERIAADALAVFCFSESPASVMGRSPREILTENDEKTRLLLEGGADVVVMADFSNFHSMSAEDFVSDVLRSALSCHGTVCGFNHRFGAGGKGDFNLLEAFFGKGFAISVPRITLDGETVSSSAVRAHLASGDIDAANRMLGHAYALNAEVVSGKKLGRRLGFPTANQAFPKGSAPLRRGVYATRCQVGEKIFFGVSNVGIRPSINEGDDHILNCETYILDFSDDIYGQRMRVEFCAYLRDEMTFSSLDDLISAIENDKARTVAFFEEWGAK